MNTKRMLARKYRDRRTNAEYLQQKAVFEGNTIRAETFNRFINLMTRKIEKLI